MESSGPFQMRMALDKMSRPKSDPTPRWVKSVATTGISEAIRNGGDQGKRIRTSYRTARTGTGPDETVFRSR